MGKRARHRRRSGHPARRDARAGRGPAARPGGGGPESAARRAVREATSLTGALDAELWASAILGVLWTHRFDLQPEDVSDLDRWVATIARRAEVRLIVC